MIFSCHVLLSGYKENFSPSETRNETHFPLLFYLSNEVNVGIGYIELCDCTQHNGCIMTPLWDWYTLHTVQDMKDGETWNIKPDGCCYHCEMIKIWNPRITMAKMMVIQSSA